MSARLSIVRTALMAACCLVALSAARAEPLSDHGEAAPAATAPKYQYRGALMVTGLDVVATPKTSCATWGFDVGSTYNLRFTPPSLGSNPAQWRLGIYWREHAESFVFNSPPTSTLRVPDGHMAMGSSFGPFTVPPSLAITKQVPPTITTTTTNVYLEGKIRNFGNNATTSLAEGCDVAFRASLLLKP